MPCRSKPRLLLFVAIVSLAAAEGVSAAETARGDRMIAEYFRRETARLAEACLAEVDSLEAWNARRELYRQQLREMLGLDPLPERTDLRATLTGKHEHEAFTVERLHFQSRPGLYVTGNLYLPRGQDEPVPAILYVCGHAEVKKNGTSYGNKTAYQHHATWFAQHGYACLVIDTLQLGEIQGIHHGTYREKMWWWNCRGYTPAGVEAWNCIRALDYLQSRPEIDGERIGVTGRSGGGAYSWWIAALDDRIKVAVPVAGITDLQNHVVDGTVEGHCDCMFMLNTYRWDYAQVAALVAPRPLLITNSDKDSIFPLEGVVRIHDQVRRIYRLHGADDKLGLQISEGPHLDTQELQVAAFRWFNRFLKDDDFTIERAAQKMFEPEQLQVFEELPADQINTQVHESFVPAAPQPAVPVSQSAWQEQRERWQTALREKCFRGWPAHAGPLELQPAFSAQRESLKLTAYDFTSQDAIRLRLYVLQRNPEKQAATVRLRVLDQGQWNAWLAAMRTAFADALQEEGTPPEGDNARQDLEAWIGAEADAVAFIAPRGVGLTAWDQSERKQTQHRRRFMLLGQTLQGMQVWDVRRAIQALRVLPDGGAEAVTLEGTGEMGAIGLYAALHEPGIRAIALEEPTRSHRQGPNFLNVLRILDLPQAAAMAAERMEVTIYEQEPGGWEYPAAVAQALGWKEAQFRQLPSRSDDEVRAER